MVARARRRLAAMALVALGLWTASATARAVDSDQLERVLRVRRGATCLTAEDLAHAVEPWLYDQALPPNVLIEVEGSPVFARAASFRVVSMGQTIAHREFAPGPPRCEHLLALLGLTIALSLRASLFDTLGRPMPDDPQAIAEAWSLTAAGVASYALLPGFAPGLELGVERGLGPVFGVRMSALAVTAPDVGFAKHAITFAAVLTGARVDACVRGELSRTLRAQVCAGIVGGVLFAIGRGETGKNTQLAWLSVADAAGASLALSRRWSLDVEVAIDFLLRPLRIGIHDETGREVDSRAVPTVGLLASIGPRYHF